MKKPCPFCGDPCDPVDDFGKPFRISGRGTVYYCEGCRTHWDGKTPKKQQAILEEKPAPEN